MTTSFVIDTHALVWFLEGSSRLGKAGLAILSDPRSRLVLPIITLAEACWLIEHGKSRIPSVNDLLSRVDADTRIEVEPITRNVLDRAVGMTVIPEMHDRLIVAIALLMVDRGDAVVLVTKDATVQASGLIPTAW